MKSYFVVATVLATLFALVYNTSASATRMNCYSSGDPHYKTFNSRYYDLYGWVGDYVLFETEDRSVSILTRIKYHKNFANRGLNFGVAISINGNVFETEGWRYAVNGNQNAELKFNGGAKIEKRGAAYFLHSSNDVAIEVHPYIIEGRDYHITVIVNAPKAMAGRVSGLCGRGDGSDEAAAFANPTRFLIDANSPRNFFGTVYVPKVIHRKVAELHWKSREEKETVEKFCREQQLKRKLDDHEYNNCVFDIRVAGGDLKAGLAVIEVEDDLKKLEQLEEMGHWRNRGSLKSVFRLLQKLKKNMLEEKAKLRKLRHNKLTTLNTKQTQIPQIDKTIGDAKAAIIRTTNDLNNAQNLKKSTEKDINDIQRDIAHEGDFEAGIKNELLVIDELMEHVGKRHLEREKTGK